MAGRLLIAETDILLVVDIQNDFLPGGALAVPDGDQVIAPINVLATRFPHCVLTQDWHPPRHQSFASCHPGRDPFEVIDVSYGRQRLWPDHCVQDTWGAELEPRLKVPGAEMIIRKGFHQQIDSYSAFFENDRLTPTGLVGYLRERGFLRVFLAGLAADYCVRYSALDALAQGFEVCVFLDACRAISCGLEYEAVLRELGQGGVHLANSWEVAG